MRDHRIPSSWLIKCVCVCFCVLVLVWLCLFVCLCVCVFCFVFLLFFAFCYVCFFACLLSCLFLFVCLFVCLKMLLKSFLKPFNKGTWACQASVTPVLCQFHVHLKGIPLKTKRNWLFPITQYTSRLWCFFPTLLNYSSVFTCFATWSTVFRHGWSNTPVNIYKSTKHISWKWEATNQALILNCKGVFLLWPEAAMQDWNPVRPCSQEVWPLYLGINCILYRSTRKGFEVYLANATEALGRDEPLSLCKVRGL